MRTSLSFDPFKFYGSKIAKMWEKADTWDSKKYESSLSMKNM